MRHRFIPLLGLLLLLVPSLSTVLAAPDMPSWQQVAERNCAEVNSRPDYDGPRDQFDRPLRCENREPVMWQIDDPIPAQSAKPSAELAADDNYEFSPYYMPSIPIYVDGMPDFNAHKSVHGVSAFDDGRIAFTYGEGRNYEKLVIARPYVQGEYVGSTHVFSTTVNGWNSRDMHIGDYNGDSRQDLAIANVDDSSRPGESHVGADRGNLAVFLDDGNGNFTQVNLDLGTGPSAIAAPYWVDRNVLYVQNWEDNRRYKVEFATNGIPTATFIDKPTQYAGWDAAAEGDATGDASCESAVILAGQWVGNDAHRLTQYDCSGTPVYYALGMTPDEIRLQNVVGDSKPDLVMVGGGNIPFSYVAIVQNVNGRFDLNTKIVLPAGQIPDGTILFHRVNPQDAIPDVCYDSIGWSYFSCHLGLAGGGLNGTHLRTPGTYSNGGDNQRMVEYDVDGNGFKDIFISHDSRGLRLYMHTGPLEIELIAPETVATPATLTYTVKVKHIGLPGDTVTGAYVDFRPDWQLLSATDPDWTDLPGEDTWRSEPFDIAAGETVILTVDTQVPPDLTTGMQLLSDAFVCYKAGCSRSNMTTTRIVGNDPKFVNLTSSAYQVDRPTRIVTPVVFISEQLAGPVNITLNLVRRGTNPDSSRSFAFTLEPQGADPYHELPILYPAEWSETDQVTVHIETVGNGYFVGSDWIADVYWETASPPGRVHVAKSASPTGTVKEGDVYSYTISVTSQLNGTVVGPVFDNLPPEVEFVPEGATPGTVYDGETHGVRWENVVLHPGQTKSFTFQVRVKPLGTALATILPVVNDDYGYDCGNHIWRGQPNIVFIETPGIIAHGTQIYLPMLRR